MERKYVDCREHQGSNCSVFISADNEDELLNLAMMHGVQKHGFKDTPEQRAELSKSLKTGPKVC